MRAMHLVVLFVVVFTFATDRSVLAQGATPSGATAGVACEEVEPRDSAAFEMMPGTPEADGAAGTEGTGVSDASPTPFAMPEGEPADDATVAEVEHLYQLLTSCLNAGDYLRAYALYTDDYLVRNLSEDVLNRLEATPVPVEDSTQSEFGGVLEAVMLEDGRIATLVTVSNPRTGDIIIHSILERDGDRLRIDDEMVVEAERTSTSDTQSQGTPAA